MIDQLRCDCQVPIWSNVVNQHGVVDLQVPGALAKQARIRQLQQESGCTVIYVGDSSTDLAALVQANVGILFLAGSQSTIRLAEQFDIDLRPLRDRDKITEIGHSSTKKIIWTVEAWDEIGDFLRQ